MLYLSADSGAGSLLPLYRALVLHHPHQTGQGFLLLPADLLQLLGLPSLLSPPSRGIQRFQFSFPCFSSPPAFVTFRISPPRIETLPKGGLCKNLQNQWRGLYTFHSHTGTGLFSHILPSLCIITYSFLGQNITYNPGGKKKMIHYYFFSLVTSLSHFLHFSSNILLLLSISGCYIIPSIYH